jgi:hypothetical protein
MRRDGSPGRVRGGDSGLYVAQHLVYRKGVTKRAWGIVSVVLFVGCGGEAPAPKAPAQAHTQEVEETEAPPSAPKGGVRCADGSCFSCGDAVCLSGYYCSVSKSGRGCAWAPSCASSPSCGCIEAAIRANPSCRCEEKNGGIFVFCDGAKL